MTKKPPWLDRTMYSALMENPEHSFYDTPLQGATFDRGRRGGLLVWSGAHAILFRAQLADGKRVAVRFSLAEGHEGQTRYDALGRHLASNPVKAFVGASWINDGLRVGPYQYPVLIMEWVDGATLDKHISTKIQSSNAPQELRTVADAWAQTCLSLVAADMSHGDIQAGNILVSARVAGVSDLRLVDYDNAWVPGIRLPSRESGHPAFRHPSQPDTDGPFLDAFPNTLTYLSLLGVASDPELWRYHNDRPDTLLFDQRDLRSSSAPIWKALGGSDDPFVRSLTTVVIQWMGGSAGRYQALDQVIETAQTRPRSERSGVLNTWSSVNAAPPDRPAATEPDPPVVQPDATITGSSAPAMRVFISYRREDTAHVAGRLRDRLHAHFGRVFMDIDNIEPGEDFNEVIHHAVGECDVLLALIGTQWIGVVDEVGRRRLDDPDDWIVQEIGTALHRGIRVIPILVDGARMPRRNELPAALAPFATRTAFLIRHESFSADADRLTTVIERITLIGLRNQD